MNASELSFKNVVTVSEFHDLVSIMPIRYAPPGHIVYVLQPDGYHLCFLEGDDRGKYHLVRHDAKRITCNENNVMKVVATKKQFEDFLNQL